MHVAAALGLPFAKEYARIHLEENGHEYDYEMLKDLSHRHIAYQRALVPSSAKAGVYDTDLINYKIWCEVAYGKCHPEIIAAMKLETNHAYLLCYPDIPWEPDPLREHPNDRMMLFDRHVAEIERLGRPYHVIKGLGADREANALAAAKRFLET